MENCSFNSMQLEKGLENKRNLVLSLLGLFLAYVDILHAVDKADKWNSVDVAHPGSYCVASCNRYI